MNKITYAIKQIAHPQKLGGYTRGKATIHPHGYRHRIEFMNETVWFELWCHHHRLRRRKIIIIDFVAYECDMIRDWDFCHLLNGVFWSIKFSKEFCKASLTWKLGETGQKGARVVEKIERHIANLNAHGNCDAPSKEELRKKAQKIVEKAREESESSSWVISYIRLLNAKPVWGDEVICCLSRRKWILDYRSTLVGQLSYY